MKTLATYSIKGGVGKTSAAVNLGALAAADGLRTVLWDLDPQGAASFLFRIKPKVKGGGKRLLRDKEPVAVMKGTDVEGLDLLPADFSYRNLDLELDRRKKPLAGVRRVLAELEGDYDLAILDCPPSISLVSENVFSAADLLLVPLVPATLSVRTLEQLRRFLAGVEQPAPEVLAFFSMVDRRKKLHRELVASLPGELPGVAAVAIPNASVVELMGLHREPVVTSAPRHKAAQAYAELWAQARAVLGVLVERPLPTFKPPGGGSA
jgi:chromosome partitioning protein